MTTESVITFRRSPGPTVQQVLATDKNPQRFRVVSNDNRLRLAARRGRCQVYSCEGFMDWLLANGDAAEEKPEAVPVPTADKPLPASEEMDEYLKAFAVPLPSSVTKLK